MRLWLVLLVHFVSAQPFTSYWSVNSHNQTIQLPISQYYGSDIIVNWGDGTSDQEYNATTFIGPPSHTYLYSSNYYIKISGQIYGWAFAFTDLQKFNILQISHWGEFVVDEKQTDGIFQGCIYLQLTATDQPIFLYPASLKNFFSTCSLVNYAIEWDVTNVTSLEGMFTNSGFNSSLILNNAGNVTSTSSMFSNTKFNQPFWFDSSNVVNMNSMFASSSFNQPLSLETGNCKTMNYMFASSKFNSPLNFTDTSNVIDMSYMFATNQVFNQEVNFDTRSVTNMNSMFYRASQFNCPLDTFSFLNVTNVNQMFSGALVFTQDFTNVSFSPTITSCSTFCSYCYLPDFHNSCSSQCGGTFRPVIPLADGRNVCNQPLTTIAKCGPTTVSPTRSPTTDSPTQGPTLLPTYTVTLSPTVSPTTRVPSLPPTIPSHRPSRSLRPSFAPTLLPSLRPTHKPTNVPSAQPTVMTEVSDGCSLAVVVPFLFHVVALYCV